MAGGAASAAAAATTAAWLAAAAAAGGKGACRPAHAAAALAQRCLLLEEPAQLGSHRQPCLPLLLLHLRMHLQHLGKVELLLPGWQAHEALGVGMPLVGCTPEQGAGRSEQGEQQAAAGNHTASQQQANSLPGRPEAATAPFICPYI